MSDRIFTEYKCKRGHRWQHYWYGWPWFGDFHMACPKCGRLTWYRYKFDENRERHGEC
jgi:hypothetical protein